MVCLKEGPLKSNIWNFHAMLHFSTLCPIILSNRPDNMLDDLDKPTG